MEIRRLLDDKPLYVVPTVSEEKIAFTAEEVMGLFSGHQTLTADAEDGETNE